MAGTRVRHPFAAAVCLALICFPIQACSGQTDGESTVSGKAIVLEATKRSQPSTTLLAILTPSGRQVHVAAAAGSLMPAGITTGMSIEATGIWVQRRFRATSIRVVDAGLAAGQAGGGALSDITVAASTSSASSVTAAAADKPVIKANPLVFPEIKAVFIPIVAANALGRACRGTARPKFTLPQLRNVLFAESNPKGVTVGSTFNTCSYGKTKLTAKNSALVDWVKLPCTGQGVTGPPLNASFTWSFDTCDFDHLNSWAEAADASLRAQGFKLQRYKHRVYLLPRGSCPDMVAQGYVGCDLSMPCRVWVNDNYWKEPNTYTHHLGHNLFLAHASAATPDGTLDEFADDTCAEGYCCANRCFNTPHAWQLGWLKVRQLDSSSLKPGQTVTASLPSQALTERSGLRILPSWAAAAPRSIFLGFRTKAGGDAELADELVSRVHIYSTNITGNYDPSITFLEASLQSGQSWSHPATGIVVRVSKVSRKAAEVSVCRQGGADPTCKKLL